jgi:hypothetical protein
VGDPIDPIAGVEDELRRHRPDEVIITTHAAGSVSWVESELRSLAFPAIWRDPLAFDGSRSEGWQSG